MKSLKNFSKLNEDESVNESAILEKWDPAMVKKYKSLEKKAIANLTKYFTKLAGESGFIVKSANVGYKSIRVEISYKNKFAADIAVGSDVSWGEDTPKWFLDPVGGVGRREDVENDDICKVYVLQGNVIKNWNMVVSVVADNTAEMYEMYQEWWEADRANESLNEGKKISNDMFQTNPKKFIKKVSYDSVIETSDGTYTVEYPAQSSNAYSDFDVIDQDGNKKKLRISVGYTSDVRIAAPNVMINDGNSKLVDLISITF